MTRMLVFACCVLRAAYSNNSLMRVNSLYKGDAFYFSKIKNKKIKMGCLI
jgi:hypothetical protein